MNRRDCKNGIEVMVASYYGSVRVRRSGRKIGSIIQMYDNYALVLLEAGYKECYFYSELERVGSNE